MQLRRIPTDSAIEEDSYDLCIAVTSPETPMTGSKLWSGYENLSMAELNRRFKYSNTECKYGNMDIAEAAVNITDRIDKLTLLPKTDYNEYTTLKKWLTHLCSVESADSSVSSDKSSGSRKKRNSQSTVKTFRQREIMGTAVPTHRLLPVESFKHMKLSKLPLCKDLCHVKRVLFDNRGKHIIVASSTNKIQIWNLVTLQHENLIMSHDCEFYRIAHMELSPDETLLVVGTHHGVLSVWDYKRRVELERHRIQKGHFRRFKLLPEPINGNYCLVVMDEDFNITMWRLRYPKIDDDSKVIVRTYGPEQPMILDLGAETTDPSEPLQEPVWRFKVPDFCTFSVSSCGRYVARNTPDSKMRVYARDHNFQLICISEQPLLRNQKHINSIAWAHHRPRFVTSSTHSPTYVWDLNLNITLMLKPKGECKPGTTKAYWSADDAWIITESITCKRIQVWDSVDGVIAHIIKPELGGGTPHPVLPQLLATVVSNEIQLWDFTRSDDQEIHTFVVNNHFDSCYATRALDLVWSPDGTILIAPRHDGKLIMFSLSKGIPVIHAPTRLERLELTLNGSTDNNIPSNIDNSNNTSIDNARSA